VIRKIYLVAFLLIFSVPMLGARKNESHSIKDVIYYPMLDGYCAITSLRMNLSYYGVEVEQSLLLNLGWDYGFFFISSPYYIGAYPDTDSVEEIVHASNLLGFKTKVLTHKSLEKAKASIVKYISQDIPVLIQWTPHTVLAYGFEDDGNTVLINDPGEPISHLMAKELSIPIGRGAQAKSRISEWVKDPYLWNYRQFQIVVVQPETKQLKIDWKEIWKRNAEKTLGTDVGAYLDYTGVKGMKKLAEGLKTHFGQNEQQFLATLQNFELTFELGVGFRRDASSFLAGQAAAMNDTSLSAASRCFLGSAYLFKKGYSLLRWLKDHPDDQPMVEEELVEIILKIAEIEEKGASFLFEASK